MKRYIALLAMFLFPCLVSGQDTQTEHADQAKRFAKIVSEAIVQISEAYYRQVTPENLLKAAIEGLFRQAKVKALGEVADQLANLRTSTNEDRLKILVDARKQLGPRAELNGIKDAEGALQEMIHSLRDPWCEYITKETVDRDFGCVLRANWYYNRLGINIEKKAEDSSVTVTNVVKDGPAYRAGVRAGDRIISVKRETNDPKEISSFKSMSSETAEAYLCGNQGTRAWLTLQREGMNASFIVEARFEPLRKLHSETVVGLNRKQDHNWDFAALGEPHIAYIRLLEFNDDTADQLAKVQKQLEDKGTKGLVIDLRFNKGGLLSSGVRICEHFHSHGKVFSILTRTEKTSFEADGKVNPWQIPIVCLINGESASAAEVIAACLQDHKKAAVVGERSAGKSCLQTVLRVPDAGVLKLTTGIFYRPDGAKLSKLPLPGRDANEWGVQPDMGLELILSDRERESARRYQEEQYRIYPGSHRAPDSMRDFKDRQLDLAVTYLRERSSRP
jgi:carboxyl-terminal processing protease